MMTHDGDSSLYTQVLILLLHKKNIKRSNAQVQLMYIYYSCLCLLLLLLHTPKKSQGPKIHVLCVMSRGSSSSVYKVGAWVLNYPKELVFCLWSSCVHKVFHTFMLFITYLFVAFVFFRTTKRQKVSPTCCVWSVHPSCNEGKRMRH